jgi:SEC-C motif
MEKIGRNDNCPCGSGLKYKKCCLGKSETVTAPGGKGSVSAELFESLKGRSFGTMKEASAFVGWQVSQQNRQARADFEGLPPEQMGNLLYSPFDSPQLVTFPKILDETPDAPLARLFMLLIDAIGEAGLKSTATGNLPRKLCREAALAFHGEEGYREVTRFGGINTEPDFSELHVTRLVAQEAGFVRRYGGKFVVAKSCRDLLATQGMRAIYPQLFDAFVRRYEWGFLDRYPEFPFIQTSFLFTLLLLTRYGEQWQPDSFYVERFLRAFPALLRDAPESPYWTPEKIVGNCYSLRSLQRFAEFLGLVEIERVGNRYIPDEINIRKLPLLDQAVRFQL